ncbi:IclR family transcriptional regulator, partial [Mycobacterium tuberculosis]|nr:IclR family transcriptional regulator [Mycobacterium tuberculosis]
MLGVPPARWRALYDDGLARVSPDARPLAWDDYQPRLAEAAARGWVYDFEENELGIRCVGAAVRDVTGAVVAGISIASAVSHMSEARMATLGPVVRATADAISKDLGWIP